MAATSKVTYSFDTDVKESCEALYDEIGLSFDLRISPDEETPEAMAEAGRLSR